MKLKTPTTVVREWQRASNEKNIDRLLELSDPDVEVSGPRGSVKGHGVLREWLLRAGLSLETLRTFARADAVVVSQRGVWKSPETGETIGVSEIATRFLVKDGRVAQIARHDGDDALDAALEEAGLTREDEA
jgi:hypothetical protein